MPTATKTTTWTRATATQTTTATTTTGPIPKPRAPYPDPVAAFAEQVAAVTPAVPTATAIPQRAACPSTVVNPWPTFPIATEPPVPAEVTSLFKMITVLAPALANAPSAILTAAARVLVPGAEADDAREEAAVAVHRLMREAEGGVVTDDEGAVDKEAGGIGLGGGGEARGGEVRDARQADAVEP